MFYTIYRQKNQYIYLKRQKTCKKGAARHKKAQLRHIAGIFRVFLRFVRSIFRRRVYIVPEHAAIDNQPWKANL